MPELPVPRSLADLLDLEVRDRDLFRGFNVGLDRHRLFDGQVAAQALRAAGLTVPEDRPGMALADAKLFVDEGS